MNGPATPAPRWSAPAHAFVDELDAPELAADDRHHLERVLRLRSDELVTVSDGRGRWRWVQLGPTLRPVGEIVVEAVREPALTVAFSVLKGERNELVVQKLTELGIDRIVPVMAERCVVRWDTVRAQRQHERLARVAREAAMQSRRCWLAQVSPVRSVAEVLAGGAAMAVMEGGRPSLATPSIVVGPEGGWTANEVASASATVALGDLVLRAETAAITSGAILAALRSGLVFPYAT